MLEVRKSIAKAIGGNMTHGKIRMGGISPIIIIYLYSPFVAIVSS